MKLGLPRALGRQPDFVIGELSDPYLLRWWVIPRNRWFNIYLHNIVRSDDDRALHDHPWWSCSIVLKGGYWEIVPGLHQYWRWPGSIVFRRAKSLHRLALERLTGPAEAASCWTLFITGPRVREWGFQCPQGWVHWRDFTAGKNGETIGRGCGEGDA